MTSKNHEQSSKRKYNKIEFTLEEEEILIELVKKNEILYNPRHKQYKDRNQKAHAWLDISREMNKKGI